MAIFEKHRGPKHGDIADCQQLMAQIYESRENEPEARRWWRTCLEMRRSLLPEGHPEILVAQDALAQPSRPDRGESAADP
jgi:hypothetical protein